MTNLKSALTALETHRPGSPPRLHETQWTAAKHSLHQLTGPEKIEELTKDVAAFANGGRVIVVGIATESGMARMFWTTASASARSR
ncbi:hypothetical protein ACFU99_04780 [Streptomyces sp. NPDC057654]|uniref:hypothetical protein n=1 Tax=Streptomyces sp. NPDC057654 TaxID=3346196 RepID=UPI0036A1D453